MLPHTRRDFLKLAGISLTGVTGYQSKVRNSEIRLEEITTRLEEFHYRTPYKFGGVPVDRATILNVTCTVRTRDGKKASGFGSMPLGNVWSFPSREMSYETTLGAMKRLAEKIARLTGEYREYGHPLDLNHVLEPEYLKAAGEISRELKLASPI